MIRALAAAIFAIFVGPTAPAFAAEGYDDTWYAADFWTGEYPAGFSVTAPLTIKIRSELSPTAERTVDCALAANATYHPWNLKRVEADKLAFKSFTKIDELTVNSAMDVTLYRQADGSEAPTHFAKGDSWRYLTYLAEGAFLMEVKGEIFEGDQALIENSTSKTPGIEGHDEWMQLTCANGANGWLLLSDTKDVAGLVEPNIVTYGESADLAP